MANEKTVSWANLTPAEATKELDEFVGGTGGIGKKGLVPAPDVGGGDGLKSFRDDGSWVSAGTGSGDLLASNNLSDVDDAQTAKSNLGMANVDDTSDADKPVSTAQQTALDLKANLAGATFTKAVRGSQSVLTSAAASIAIDLDDNNDFTHTTTEDTTLANPSNVTVGQSGSIFFTQDAVTPRLLSFDSFYKFTGGTVPALTAVASAEDTLDYKVRSATFIECSLRKAIS